MLDRININYTVVAGVAAVVQSEAKWTIDTINTIYDQILSDANGFDGATQAGFVEAAQSNRIKAIDTINTLLKLNSFIVNSSERIRQVDERTAAGFTTAGGNMVASATTAAPATGGVT